MRLPATHATSISLTAEGVEIEQVIDHETSYIYLSFEQAAQIMEWLVTRAEISWQEPASEA